MLKTVASPIKSSNLIPLIHLLIALLLVGQVHSVSLSVVPTVRTINSITTFDWNITGLTGTTNTVVLRFPAVVTLNATNLTLILTSDGNPYTGTQAFSGNNITITVIPAEQTNSTLFFKVTNVKNPSY